MKLSDISIRNPVFAWMLMFAIILFGIIGFQRLGVSQMPDVDFPVLNISVTLTGASPEVMESTVVDPLEDAVIAIEGVKNMSSSSKTGSANITLEFDLNKNIDVALQEVQTKVAQAQKLLPKDIDPPVITKSNPEDQPIIWLALTYDKDDPVYMMKYAHDILKDKFTTIPGVGEIFFGGYTAPALRIWVKSDELRRRNIAVNDLVDAVTSEHSELPGGSIDQDKKSFNVRTMGEAQSVEEFGNIALAKRAGQIVSDPSQMVRLKQVARVEEGLDEVRRVSRFNEVRALGVGVRKLRGANAVAVAHAVKARLKEIEPELSPGMKVSVNFDSTRFIEQSVHEMNQHLMLAVILTSLVCWIFLGSWSATFNVLLSIPTSIFGAFLGMYFFNFTLNTFTLLGLTLAIGIVVDDAIMVLENIFRYQEQKKGRIVSAILGTREITFAAIAATVAVIAIFLPVAFMQGVIGKYFLQFGVTISMAVFLSLVESLTITPMRAASFIQSHERKDWLGKKFEALMRKIERGYGQSLAYSLAHKNKVFIAAVVFMVVSFMLVPKIPKEFVPVQDQGLFLARLQTPVGSSLAYTDEKVHLAEKWFRAQPEVKQVYASVGGFSNGAADANSGMMFITLTPKGERKASQQDMMARARSELSKIPDLKAFMQDLSLRGFSSSRGFPIEFTLQGNNWETLWDITQKTTAAMKDSGMMVDIDTNYLLGMPEIQIKPNRIEAALHGVSVQGIGQTINALIGGVKVGQFPKDGRRYDIILKLEGASQDPADIKKLFVGNARSNLVPLSEVTTQSIKPSLQQISRQNRVRAITVFANMKPGFSQEKALALISEKAKSLLVPGYRFEVSGGSQTMKESFQGLIFSLILGLMVAYMVLASQFNSFLDPVSVLSALPFAISGAFFALLITFQSLNIYSMIGILLLMGIVKKNSIMLVEFTNTVRDRGTADARSALQRACPIRLRPILMTSIATIAAAVPSALATGEGSETTKPMSITIIGGVALSTLLTLYVVPCLYLILDRFRKRDADRQKIEEAFVLIDGAPPAKPNNQIDLFHHAK